MKREVFKRPVTRTLNKEFDINRVSNSYDTGKANELIDGVRNSLYDEATQFKDEKIYHEHATPRQVYRMRIGGLADERIAGVLMVTGQTLLLWLKKYPALKQAWDDGGIKADSKVAAAMYKRAIGWKHESTKLFYNSKEDKVVRAEYTEKFAPDVAAGTFWLTNRQSSTWKVRSSTEHTGKDGKALAPPTIIINPVVMLPGQRIPPTIEGDQLLIQSDGD